MVITYGPSISSPRDPTPDATCACCDRAAPPALRTHVQARLTGTHTTALLSVLVEGIATGMVEG